MSKAPRMRLDHLVVARGLAETRSKAQALIVTGAVKVNGETCRRPAESTLLTAEIELAERLPYVSRGGYKLAHALDAFAIDVTNQLALDVGASTGGFTDVLLQRGACGVYAVDVGYGILDYSLRTDARVVVMERTNVRFLESLPDHPATSLPVTICVIDVAFISLRLVLPAVWRLLAPTGVVVALIKPQFEAGVEQVGKGGVVRDVAVRAQTIRGVVVAAAELGWGCHGLVRSPIQGPAGNVEFLAWFAQGTGKDMHALIDAVDLK